MRRVLTAAILGIAAAGMADAALQTRAMDALETVVQARRAALPQELDRTGKRQRKALDTVLRLFQLESRDRRQDSRRIRTMVRTLDRLFADDTEIQDALTTGLAAFGTELDAEMARIGRGLTAVDEANRRRNRAQVRFDRAQQSLGDLGEAPDHLQAANLCCRAVDRIALAERATWQALDVDTTLTPHEDAFLRVHPEGYTNAADCVGCHADAGAAMLQSRHWLWNSDVTDDPTVSGAHGKADLINNFCIAVPSNEGRCTQCHTGIGWKNGTFDFGGTAALDCLVCHDTTGTYKKDTKTAGAPLATVDLQQVALLVGAPGRGNCGACHWNAGGGDNVKVGDMASTLANPTRDLDVHMDASGANMTCQACHSAAQPGSAATDTHAALEQETSCERCHTDSPHQSANLNQHTARVACETCHIPTFARGLPTKVNWDWSTAGQNVSPIPTDQYGKATYDKMKGTFVWAKFVTPELRWHNGQWRRTYVNANNQWTTLPYVLAQPLGSKDDPSAKIRPFKKMVGKQPADAVNRTILVPHLFGTGPGANPYWTAYNWAAALAEGAAYAGQTYSGQFEFVETEMYLGLHHEIAPAADARGCTSCHSGGIDWTALGYAGDPWFVTKK